VRSRRWRLLAFSAGNAQKLGAVAQVAPELAENRRNRVGAQRRASRGVVAVDGLDQADRADLGQILELLAAVGESSREHPDEGEVHLDQPPARLTVPTIAPGSQKLLLPRRHTTTLPVASTWIKTYS
jgi:hypothetical protein